jgi:type II secretory pathway component PulF
LLLLAGVGTLVLMIGVVLPRFAALLHEADVSLPRSTTLLLSVGEIAADAAIPTLIAFAAAMAIADSMLSSPKRRMKLHQTLLSLPAIGPWRLRTASAQVCSTLQGLLSAGLPIVRALDISAETMSDRAIGQRARQARESIVRGAAPATAFREARLLSDTALGLVAAGESSGRLIEMLRHASDLDQSAATRQLQTLVRLLEPSLIILLGGLIAGMAASLLQAMYAVRP